MRLIDADALMERLSKKLRDGDVLYNIPPSAIDNAPTIDAVPVVQCKDCANSAEYPWRPEDRFWCPVNNRPVCVDDFCSDGVKKEEDKNGCS